MFWLVVIFIFFLGVLGFIFFVYFKDRRYMRSKLSAVMREQVRKELEEELEAANERKHKFTAELKKADEKIDKEPANKI